jgi:hypothetical protein
MRPNDAHHADKSGAPTRRRLVGRTGDSHEVPMSEQKNIYSSFKNDKERLWALISRDLRIVAITAICATLGTPSLLHTVTRWL